MMDVFFAALPWVMMGLVPPGLGLGLGALLGVLFGSTGG